MRASRGFTLLDVLVALAIAAVLCAIALPTFDAALRKARRADALVAVVQIQAAQERLRSRTPRYGDMAEIGAVAFSQAGHYRLQVTAFDADGYALLATAIGPQAGDSTCRYLGARAVGLNLSYASGADAALGNGAAPNRACWSL